MSLDLAKLTLVNEIIVVSIYFLPLDGGCSKFNNVIKSTKKRGGKKRTDPVTNCVLDIN